MRLTLLVLAALFLITSCASHKYNKTLEGLHGASIDQAVAVLGEPTSKEAGVFVWNKERMQRGGGYYHQTYQTTYRQGPRGERIMEQRPQRHWVAPYEHRLWCDTAIHFSDTGIITNHIAEGNDCKLPKKSDD
ncbi:MAG: hypothetical protein FWF95_07855 [Syntrophorhabdaceae bacterium]|nr:hypothetical protein [Syntrophorhabdaceae bacterium]